MRKAAIVTALDVPSGLSQVIKSAPGLFVSTATTTGAVGVVSSPLVLLGSMHLVPAASLALGSSPGGGIRCSASQSSTDAAQRIPEG
jgi:hypothetical protein